MISGFIAAFVANPFDVIKSRVMRDAKVRGSHALVQTVGFIARIARATRATSSGALSNEAFMQSVSSRVL